MVVVQGEADLLEIVGAVLASRSLASTLHCGEQQADEHANNRDHDEEFDQRETRPNSV